jgi:hypothetical protein
MCVSPNRVDLPRMGIRRLSATAIALVVVSALASMSPAHAQSAPVNVTVVGVITVSTPPAGAVLVPPASLPGNATGTDAMVITSNTAYHVTVKADNAKMRPWSGSAYVGSSTIGSALSLVPQAAVGTPTLTNVSMTTSDQTIVASAGATAETYTFNFTQPVSASDPLGLYRTVLTYTVSAGLS